MPLKKELVNERRRKAVEEMRKNLNPLGGSTKRTTTSGSTGSNGLSSLNYKLGGSSASSRYNYGRTPQNQWNAPQLTAYGRLNNDTGVYDYLSQATDQPGSQYYNPCRGGRAVQMGGFEDFVRNKLGYDGPITRELIGQINELYGGSTRYSDKMGVLKPTKKSTDEEWAAYYGHYSADYASDNDELNRQYAEYRQELSNFYDQYVKINGREPSLQEFESAVDRSKYSKLKAYDAALVGTSAMMVLPLGTNYAPDIVAGLFQAKRKGQDINVDRDYFDDSVQYYMDPVQSAPSLAKYEWSGSDLSGVSEEDRDRYDAQLRSEGNNEEAAAYRRAWWAAQPHLEGVPTEPPILDASFGYYHDDQWFDAVEKAIGDEYDAGLDFNGDMSNPGKNGDYLAQARWELHQELKKRPATDAIETEFNGLKDRIQELFNQNYGDYTADQFQDFRADVLYHLGLSENWDSEEYHNISALSSELNNYLKNGYDPDKHCRVLNVSKENLNTIIKRVWDGEDVSQNADYSADPEARIDAPSTHVEPDELPVLYNEQQRAAAQQRMVDRDNAERSVVESTVAFSDSGAQAPKGSVSVVSAAFERMANFGDALLGMLGRLWKDVRGDKYEEKLGPVYSDDAAAAVDPVLNQLDTQNMPEQVTAQDIFKLANAYVMSHVSDDDITLVHGILGYAVPGIQHLYNAMLENPEYLSDVVSDASSAVSNAFNALTYKSVYEDRVEAGYDEEEAASVAFFAATTADNAVKSIAISYEGDDALEAASNRLVDEITNEEGSKDTIDLIKRINDDVEEYRNNSIETVHEHARLMPETDMADFNAALIFGSSSFASPGFRAETNQLTHDIAAGAILPEEIMEAVDFNNWTAGITPDTDAEARLGPARDFLKETEPASAFPMDEVIQEGKAILAKAGPFLSIAANPSGFSEDLKKAIGYDALKSIFSDNPYMADQTAEVALDNLVHPYKEYQPSTPMEGRGTDFLTDLDQITGQKTEKEIGENLVAARRFDINDLIFGGDLAGMANELAIKDRSGAIAAILAYIPGIEQTDFGRMTDLMRAKGKWLSPNEMDAAWKAFLTGKASFDDIFGLVSARTEAVDQYTVNALNNPAGLEKSTTAMDTTLEGWRSAAAEAQNETAPTVSASDIAQRLFDGEDIGDLITEYPEAFEDADIAGISETLANRGVLPDEQILGDIGKQLKEQQKPVETFEESQIYTEDQLATIEGFLETYKNMGADGYQLAVLDNEKIKTISGGVIDLDAAGFSSPVDLLDQLDPDWAKPYNYKPGIDSFNAPFLENVASAMGKGLRDIISLPAQAYNFGTTHISGLIGEDYDPANDNSYLGSAYNRVSEVNAQAAADRAANATDVQSRIYEVVSNLTKFAVLEGIGGTAGTAAMEAAGSEITGIPLAIQNISAAAGRADAIGKFVTRLPRVASTFLNAFDQAMQQGKSVNSATIRALSKASIHQFTNGAFARWNIFSYGGAGMGEHAANATDRFGDQLVSWAAKLANNTIKDIGRAEAIDLLDRLYDTGENIYNGAGVGESLNQAVTGFLSDLPDSALTTGLMTLILGAVDLGGMVYDRYIKSSDTLNTTELSVDLAENQDVPTPEDIARAEMAGVMAHNLKYGDVRYEGHYQGAPVWSFTNEHAEQGQQDILNAQDQGANRIEGEFVDTDTNAPALEAPKTDASTYNPATDVPTFRKPGKPSGSESYNPETDIPHFGKIGETPKEPSALDKADQQLQEAAIAMAESPSDEAANNLDSAIASFQAAYSESAQEPTEQAPAPTEQASAPTDVETPAPSETAPVEAPALSENARRISAYMEHAKAAMDDAVVDQGASMEAELAIAEDDSLASKADAIVKMQGKIEETQQRITGLQQSAQKVVGQLEQMYRAAADLNLTQNAPQVIDSRNKKTQAHAALQSDIAAEQEKLDTQTREMQDAKDQLDAETERKRQEAKESAVQEYQKKLEEKRQKEKEEKEKAEKDAADDALAEAALALFTRTRIDPKTNQPQQVLLTPRQVLTEMEAEDERALNAQKAEQNGQDVHGLFTDEEWQKNRKDIKAQDEAGMKDYIRHIAEGGTGTTATEEFVDPNSNSNLEYGGNKRFGRRFTPAVTDHREDEWKDASKQRQDQLSTDVEADQRERTEKSFVKFREDANPEGYVDVPYALFKSAKDAAKDKYGAEFDEYRFFRVVNDSDKGNPAEIARYTTRDKRDEKTAKLDLAVVPKSDTIRSAADFRNDNGTITGLGYQAITAADPEFVNYTGNLMVSPTNGSIEAALELVNENERYLIVKPMDTGKDSYDRGNSVSTTDLQRLEDFIELQEAAARDYTFDFLEARDALLVAESEFWQLSPKLTAKAYKIDMGRRTKAYKRAKDRLTYAQDALQKNAKLLGSLYQRRQEALDHLAYNPQGPQKDTPHYIIDKTKMPTPAQLSTVYRDAAEDAAMKMLAEFGGKPDEELAAALIQHGMKAIEGAGDDIDAKKIQQSMEKRFNHMSRDQLVEALTKIYTDEFTKERMADMFRGTVRVVRDTEKATAQDQINKFIEQNGDVDDYLHIGGPEHGTFFYKDHYKPGNRYLLTEEAALRFLPAEALEKIGFTKTKALYNARTSDEIAAYARQEGLSDEATDALRSSFLVRGDAPPTKIGKNTVIKKNDSFLLAVPDKTLNNPTRNTWLQDSEGNTSVDMALYRLESKLDWMMEQSEMEAKHRIDPDTQKEAVLDTKVNSIEVWFTDDAGNKHDRVRVGEYYSWWNGGSKFFPGYGDLLEIADKITCNFPCRPRKPGVGNFETLVSFTIVPNNFDAFAETEIDSELNAVDLEAPKSELGHLRGHGDLVDEAKRIDALLAHYTNDKGLQRAGMLASAHAHFNLWKNELLSALQRIQSSSPDKKDALMDAAARWYMKMQYTAGRIYQLEKPYTPDEEEKPNSEEKSSNHDQPVNAPNTVNKAVPSTKPQGFGDYYDELFDKQNQANLEAQRKHITESEKWSPIGHVSQYDEDEEIALDGIDSDIAAIADRRTERFTRRFNELKKPRAEAQRPAEADDQLPDFVTAKMASPDQIVKSYNEAKERYTKLTDPKNEQYTGSYFDNERAMLAAILPGLRERAELVQDQAEPAQQPAPKTPDPVATAAADEIAKKIEGPSQSGSKEEQAASDLAGLAALKAISDMGADIDKQRTQATEAYHQKAMDGMTDEQKMDYMANLADQQAITPDTPTIDPNTNYDEQLAGMIEDQAAKEQKKTSKRLKAIGKKAGIGGYKTIGGVNRAMAELDEMEKSGLNVQEARTALQKNLDTLNTPYQAKKEAIIASEPDKDFQMNLRLFTNESQDEAVDAILDQMALPSEPADIDTGFNGLISDVQNANAEIDSEGTYNAARDKISDLRVQLRELGDTIDEKAKKAAWAEKRLTEINKEIDEILKATNTTFNDSKASGQYDKLARKMGRVMKQIADTEADIREHGENDKNRAMSAGLAKDLEQTRKLMASLESGLGAKWNDRQRGRYGDLLAQSYYVDQYHKKHSAEKDSLVSERDATKAEYKTLGRRIAASELGQRIVRNNTTFNKTKIEDDNPATVLGDRITQASNNAKKLLANMKASGMHIHGVKTTYTPENFAKLMTDGIVDEERLAFDSDVAIAANNALKDMKEAVALMDYGVAVANFKLGRIKKEELEAAEAKARDSIFHLTRITGYGTKADAKRENKAREAARQAIADYRVKLDTEILTGNITNGKEALDWQLEVLNNKIKRTEEAVHDYFGLSSTNDLLSAIDGSHGGRQPQVVIDTLVGAVWNGTRKRNGKQKNEAFAPVTRLLRDFGSYTANVLGEYAPIVNSNIVDPVLQSEGKAAAWLKDKRDKLKPVKPKTTEERLALGHVLEGNMTDDEIRSAYPEHAETLIKAKPVYQQVLQIAIEDQNPILSRNGQEPIKWHQNYYPHQQQEQNAFFRFLGINAEADTLPTGLLGHTEGTVPSSQFAAHRLERTGEETDNINWNAVEVVDRYLNSAAAIIFQTDNIVRINDFITALGGNRKPSNDPNVDLNDEYAAISPLEYSSTGQLAKRGRYSLYIKALETWRDQVAGKKTGALDRAAESQGTRAALSTIKTLTKLQGVAKVGGNLKTCALNTIPMITSAAMHPISSTEAGYSLIANRMKGFSLLEHPDLQRSAFFWARHGNERIANCTFDKATGVLFVPMEYTDRVSTAYTWLGNYYSTLKQLGGTGYEKQAAQMADKMTRDMMGSKMRGDKGEGYNSTVGGAFLQFTQEAVNQVGFLAQDMNRYHGGGLSGLAKTLAGAAAVFLAGYVGNKIVGANSTIDPFGVITNASKKIREGGNANDVIKQAITDFIDQLNPVDNITSGNLLEAPVASATLDVLNALIGDSLNAGIDAMFGGNEDDADKPLGEWAQNVASALWGWVPASTQLKRFYDTYKAARQGYAATNDGQKMKYPLDPTAGNLIQSAAFGPNATKYGQEYVKRGYKPENQSDSEAMKSLIDAGFTASQAYHIVKDSNEAKAKKKEADEAARWGEDNTEQLDDARSLREQAGMPGDLNDYTLERINEPWAKKAVDMWRESGLITYPTKLTIYDDKERGFYFMSNGKNIPIAEEEANKITDAYNRRAKQIINSSDDPKDIANQLTKLRDTIKSEFTGGK